MTYSEIINIVGNHKATLVAVSKTKPNAQITELYNKGQRIFGENRVQELTEKYNSLPKDIEWHMIGHLQKNKVKYIAPFVAMIHSVDTLNLLNTIQKEAVKNERTIAILLQIKIGQEAAKSGFAIDELNSTLDNIDFKIYPNIQFSGVMGMASFVDDQSQIKQEFASLKNHFDHLKSSYFNDKNSFSEISMGMSGDFQLALAEGSTMVRIGSLLFGSR